MLSSLRLKLGEVSHYIMWDIFGAWDGWDFWRKFFAAIFWICFILFIAFGGISLFYLNQENIEAASKSLNFSKQFGLGMAGSILIVITLRLLGGMFFHRQAMKDVKEFISKIQVRKEKRE